MSDRDPRMNVGTLALQRWAGPIWIASSLVFAGVACAQGTAISYQGRLNDGGRAVTGTYDLTFTLFGQLSGGTAVKGPITFSGVGVTNGLFTLTLDFGAGAFDASSRWIEMAVRTNGGASYTTLSPRRGLLPSPQAIYAGTAGQAQTVPAAGVSGTLTTAQLPVLNVSGAGLTGLNASQLASGTVPDARLSGNVPKLDATQVFGASNRFNGPVTALHASNAFAGTFTGNGAALTGLTASAVVGTVSAATNFTGELSGDVTGGQSAAIVATVGGATAVEVASGVFLANAATPNFTCDAIIRRDAGTGGFTAGPIRATHFVGDGSGLTNLPTSPNQYGAPKGALLASSLAADPTLISAGYRLMMTIPAPGWTAGATLNAPSTRHRHTAVWDGQRMIVWGGLIGSQTPTATGGYYDPASDVWTTVSTVGAPAARSEHTAVWTGTQMIVWGGLGASSYLGTGGRFTPGSQAWAATATSGAPSSRSGHVAVWTGSKMIVWGGRNLSGLLNDGGIYDPAANTWTALPTLNAPEARMGAVAVWTGTSLYVWGGQGETGELGTGGELAFAAGSPTTWAALPTANAPSPRMGHTALWAGDRMIVWGGQASSVPLGDGAAYCPGCGGWTAVSMVNAPVARTGHAAVWSGGEMMVMGGANGGGDVSSAAAYDPQTSEWRSLSALGAPLARSGATAVWTSTDLLVFGGTSGGTPVATLQRLFPQPEWYFYRKL